MTDDWLNTIQREAVEIVEASGLSLDSGDDTQLRQAIQLLAGQKTSVGNLLANGAFRIDQRVGPHAFAAGTDGYCLDRWFASMGTAGVASISKEEWTEGAAPAGTGRNFLRWNHTTSSTAAGYLQQRVEMMEELSNRQVTFSFWAKVSSGSIVVTPRVTQDFGTGGSPSSQASVNGTAQTITTTLTRFTVTVTVPSISGKTIGTDENFWTGFDLVLPTGVTFTLDLAGMQVEIGTSTDFAIEPIAVTFGRCARYFQKSYEIDTAPGTVTAVGQVMSNEQGGVVRQGTQGMFAFPMRTTPSMTIYSPSTGNAGKADNAGSEEDAFWASSSEYSHGAVQFTVDPGGNAITEAHYVADAEL